MLLSPRDYQSSSISRAMEFLDNAQPGQKHLEAGPTGSGKSVCEVELQRQIPDSFIICPKEEIIWGMVDKGADPQRISTPLKLRNAMLRGEIPNPPSKLIFDETHHHNATSWQQIDLLTGMMPAVGYTATPYRGTPKATAEFIERWGNPHWMISYPDAVKTGVISFPSIKTLPLIDDDLIDISNGEFNVTRIESESKSQYNYLANYLNTHYFNAYSGEWYRPTIINVPSSAMAWEFAQILNARKMMALTITDETSKSARQLAFELTVGCKACLIHIDIVTEGIDLPLRVMLDLCPMMSPVRFVQKFGRITRAVNHGEESPIYICTNRNVLRHAYLFGGCIPQHDIKEAQDAFPTQSKRAGIRVIGLEGLGRFKPAEIPLDNGMLGTLYCLQNIENNCKVEYAAILHPLHPDVIWARKESTITNGVFERGNWQYVSPPNDVQGFASVSAGAITPNQLAWWKKSAKYYGLKPDAKVTNKNFQCLPILANLGIRFNAN